MTLSARSIQHATSLLRNHHHQSHHFGLLDSRTLHAKCHENSSNASEVRGGGGTVPEGLWRKIWPGGDRAGRVFSFWLISTGKSDADYVFFQIAELKNQITGESDSYECFQRIFFSDMDKLVAKFNNVTAYLSTTVFPWN